MSMKQVLFLPGLLKSLLWPITLKSLKLLVYPRWSIRYCLQSFGSYSKSLFFFLKEIFTYLRQRERERERADT